MKIINYKNIFLIVIIILLCFTGCNSLNNNVSYVFEADSDEKLKQLVNEAWQYYYNLKYDKALEKFMDVLNSKNEEFIKTKSSEFGIRCGLGYSLLQVGKHDEALYQFEYENDILFESALGAAIVYFLKRNYEMCENSFKYFEKIYFEKAPYKIKFNVLSNPNFKAHELLFWSYFYKNNKELMLKHYLFLKEEPEFNLLFDNKMNQIILNILKNELN